MATDGIAGLYRGFAISCVGIVVYRGLYFGLYDSLKPALGPYSDNFLASFVLGWGITNFAGGCMHLMHAHAYWLAFQKLELFACMQDRAMHEHTH